MTQINSSWQENQGTSEPKKITPQSPESPYTPPKPRQTGFLLFLSVLILGAIAAGVYFVLYSTASPEKKIEEAFVKTLDQESADLSVEVNISDSADQADSPFKTQATANFLGEGLNIKALRDDSENLNSSGQTQGSFAVKGTFGGIAVSIASDYVILNSKFFLRFSELAFASSAIPLTDLVNKWLFIDTQQSPEIAENLTDQPLDTTVCTSPKALEDYFLQTGFIKSIGSAKRINSVQAPDEQATRYEILIEKDKVDTTLAKIEELGGCNEDIIENLSSENIKSLIVTIGNQSGLIRKIEIDLAGLSNFNDGAQTLNAKVSVGFSDFNNEPVVEEPQNATSLEQVLTELLFGEFDTTSEELLPLEH